MTETYLNPKMNEATPKGEEIGKHLPEHTLGSESEFHRQVHDMMKSPSQEQLFLSSGMNSTAHIYLPSGFEITGISREEETIKANEGALDIVNRKHPAWTAEHRKQEADRIEKEVGRKTFTIGEQIHSNEDGSVTTRVFDGENFRQSTFRNGQERETTTHTVDGKGGFSEVTDSKEDGSRKILTVDKHGNWKAEIRDESGEVNNSSAYSDGTLTYFHRVFGADHQLLDTHEGRIAADGSSISIVTVSPYGDKMVSVRDKDGNYTFRQYDQDGRLTKSYDSKPGAAE